MYVLLLFLLVFNTLAQSNGVDNDDDEVIQCQDQIDYHSLLFRICEKSAHCSRLYYIDPELDTSNFTHISSGIRKLHDFDRFNHQMERIFMFDTYEGDNTLTNISSIATQDKKILSTMLPPQWFMKIRIKFTSSDASSSSSIHTLCSEAYDILDPTNRLFVYSVLMSLQTFKLFISEEYACSDPNEKLYMTGDGTFKCICNKGKSCNNESNFATILIILITFLLLAVILWIFITFYSTVSTSRQIQELRQYNNSDSSVLLINNH